MQEGSLFSTSSPAFVVCRFFDDGHSNFYEVKPHKMVVLICISLSRGITLSAKVHLVKAVVFPVVMYRCESWTVKKAER